MDLRAALLLCTWVGCSPDPGGAPPFADTATLPSTLLTSTDALGEATLYPADQVHSPLTPSVITALATAFDRDRVRQADVFAKVGASSTVSHNTLYCFAQDPIALGEHTALQEALDTFLGGNAAGTTPFDRDTLAAISGKTASWAIDGPLQDEIAAIQPRFALVHYGTNDMNMGLTYHSALHPFYENLDALVQISLDEGTIPVLFGISPRLDSDAANLWVSTYNATIRGLAQRWQVPFVDLYTATNHLENQGMSGDGLHLEAYSGGACDLTAEGLAHGYNVRNLIALQTLDRLNRTLVLDEAAPDARVELAGTGGPDAPWEVPSLPFSHSTDTRDSPWSEVDVWDCDDADESGPEVYYTLEISQTTEIRAVLLDPGDTDIDIHLLDDSGTCVDRAHQLLERTLEPGTWRIALDSWSDAEGVAQSGMYQLVVVAM